jgi:hypothetical protein
VKTDRCLRSHGKVGAAEKMSRVEAVKKDSSETPLKSKENKEVNSEKAGKKSRPFYLLNKTAKILTLHDR